MTPSLPWWESVTPGAAIPMGIVRVEVETVTAPWKGVPDEEKVRTRARFVAGIEHIAVMHGAAIPPHWNGDAVVFVLGGVPWNRLAAVTFRAVRDAWDRTWIDLGLPVRIAADVVVGPLENGFVDRSTAAHLASICASATIGSAILSEDLVLMLPDRSRIELRRSMANADGALYTFPSDDSPDAAPDAWNVLRNWANSPEVRLLKYVGLRLQKRQPPSLDVRDVFVPSLIMLHDRAHRGRDPWPMQRRAPSWEPEDELEEPGSCCTVSLPQLFEHHRKVVLLGDPGIGKSTLLRWLAVTAAAGRFALAGELGIHERLLPVIASIGRLAEVRRVLVGEPSIPTALAHHLADRGIGDFHTLADLLERELAAGRCLVLLDGLDEVASSERAAVLEWIERFARDYPHNRLVITSRIVGFAGIDIPDAIEASLYPFDDTQAERYVRVLVPAWHKWERGGPGGPNVDATREADHLLEAIRASSRLTALARNPFMLSALVLIHRAEGKLPRHRVQAYQVIARSLCETWADARRIAAGARVEPSMPYEEEALPILGELAIAMHERYPTGVAPEAFVMDTLVRALGEQKGDVGDEAERTAREFLKRAGEEVQILLERGAGQWGFLHLTFQEFFVAAGLHAQERFEEVALSHLFDARWEEVIRLGVGYMALVQQRPVAARRFVEKVLMAERPPS